MQAFLDYMLESKKAGRPGVSVVVVSMQELEQALHLHLIRAELSHQLSHAASRLQARFFNLNNRLLVIVPPQDEWKLMQCVYEIRMLVLSKVGRKASELGLDPSEFTTVLHTRRQANKLARLAREAVLGRDDLKGAIGPGGELTQGHIEAISQRAAAAGAAAFLREFGRMQAIVRMDPEATPQPVGREIYISMADLGRQLLMGVNLGGSRNLFRELTCQLDRIVLRALAESRLVQGQVSVNLNVSSLETDDFERLARQLHQRDAAELWVELDVTDVLGNLKQFKTMRKMLQRYGVYVMADSMAPELVPAAEETGLALDGYKFVFTPEDPGLGQLREALSELSGVRRGVVLTRVEHEAAVSAGQSIGLRHFQGFYIDDLLGQNDRNDAHDQCERQEDEKASGGPSIRL